MFKNIIILLAVFCCSTQLFSQTTQLHWQGEELELGTTYFAYANNLTLRKEPSLNAEKIALLPINQELKVISVSDKTMLLNGYNSSWVEVQAGVNTGFVVSGLLANGRFRLNDGSFLLYNKNANPSYTKAAAALQFRKVSNNSAAYIELGEAPLHHDTFAVVLHNNKGLTGIDHIIEIDLTAEACGLEGGTGYATLAFEKGKINYLGFYNSVFDGGAFHMKEALVFPGDKEGRPDTIIYKGEEGGFVDDEENEYRTVQKVKSYAWINGRLERPIVKFTYN